MIDKVWDFLVDTMMTVFMPLVCSYYAISASVFINVSVKDAEGIEWLANSLLSPAQYLLAGKLAVEKPDGTWNLVQRYEYHDRFWFKTATSILSLPPSLLLGGVAKALSLMDSKVSQRYDSLVAWRTSKEVYSNLEHYQKIGLNIGAVSDLLTPLGCKRRPGDENVLALEKEALREIGRVLNEAGIPWWIDCGTCLGAYRYGGVIPWDCDIDVAVLLPDFENVCRALNCLDPNLYMVQDWSTRDHPDSYLKVYIRKSGTLIDIYHFAIDAETKELNYILSLETNMFFPEWWKIRERRFKVPVAFNTVFPLKKAKLDGVEVFVPNETKKYLQRCYGENLDPVKIYDPQTCTYEKDLSHPYWQRAYAH